MMPMKGQGYYLIPRYGALMECAREHNRGSVGKSGVTGGGGVGGGDLTCSKTRFRRCGALTRRLMGTGKSCYLLGLQKAVRISDRGDLPRG